MDWKDLKVLAHQNTIADKFQIKCIMDEKSDREKDFVDTNEILFNEIKRLEQEKAEIERRNREKELLEQKLRELKGSISSLKGGNTSNSTATTPTPSGSGKKNGRKQLSPINIAEALATTKNKLDTSYHSEHEDSNNESPKSSDDEEVKAEEVMSAVHKQRIQLNRDTLVDNMIPDDIFNDLIAGKILTTADVSRIKKRTTREAINEELLNNLVLKSDRAFFVFTKSLRKTLQEYLANLLEPPPKSRKKQKRKMSQRGEMNVSLDVNDILFPNSPTKKPTCTCQEVEEQILIMARNAFKNIRRRDESASSFEQFRKELTQTNTVIKDSMEVMNTLKLLCRHGDITDITRGSVKFTMHFHSVQDLNNLWSLYESGELLTSFQSTLITHNMLEKLQLRSIKLGLRIYKDEYESCLKEFSTSDNVSKVKKEKKQLRIQVPDCPSLDPENTPSPKTPYNLNGPRKAFNELQAHFETRPMDAVVKTPKTPDTQLNFTFDPQHIASEQHLT